MGPLALLGLAALCTGLGRAEVVPDFSPCSSHFYGQEAPQGFGTLHTASICQQYNNLYRFATFYDKRSRTPLWSAYTLDPTKCQEKIVKTWKVEPQLSGLPGRDMMNEGDIIDPQYTKNQTKEKLKQSQAINEDYDKTGYDRGHLNPNAFQCDDGCTATFTLTNAAPMDPRFNRVLWRLVERNIKAQLIQNCPEPKQNAFLVTGVVPNDHHKIPDPDEDRRRGIKRETWRVAIPSNVWVAVCCNHPDNNQKFAFAFLGRNNRNGPLQAMTVTELNRKVAELSGKSSQGTWVFGKRTGSLQIFKDDCNEDSRKSQDVLREINRKLHIDIPSMDQNVRQRD